MENFHEKLISIKKTDWHYRLIKYVFGIEPSMFKNLCPYFWLTVASLFLFIFVSLYRVCKYVYKKIYYGIINMIDRNIEKDFANYLKTLSQNQIVYLNENKVNNYELWDSMPKSFKNKYTIRNMVDKWRMINHVDLLEYNKILTSNDYKKYEKSKNDEHDKKLKVSIENTKIKEQERIRKEKEKRENREKLNKVIKYTKLVFGAIITLLLCFGALLLCLIFINLFTLLIQIIHDNAVEIAKGLLFIVGGLSGLIVSNIYYNFVENKFQRFIDGNKTSVIEKVEVLPALLFYGIYKVLYYVFYVFLFKWIIVSTFKGFKVFLVNFTGIFGEYFNASYSDYCPGIEWKEDSEDKK